MTTPHRTRRLLKGWWLFLFTLTLVVAGAWWNDHMARTAPLQPVHPREFSWTFSTYDFPGFWQRLEEGDVVQKLADDWPRPQSSIELAIRKSVGIRPNPSRWRVWLGYRLAVSATSDGIGISAYPGWVLRAADIALLLATSNRDSDGVSHYGDWFYGWRNGFLVASKSRNYVAGCLTRPDPTPLLCRDDGVPVLEWKGESEGYVRFLHGDGLPIEGNIKVGVSDGQIPLTLSRAWPTPPALCVTARDPNSLAAISMLPLGIVTRAGFWLDAAQFSETCTRVWGLSRDTLQLPSGTNQISLALLNVDATHALPVPSIAVAMRGNGLSGEPSLSALPQNMAYPYEWNGHPGKMTPLLGESLSLFTCTTGDDSLVSTSESVMPQLAGRLALGSAENVEIDVVLSADWKKMADSLERLAQVAGELQLLPRMNADDVRYTISPKLKGLSKLGSLSLTGRAEQGRIVFSGNAFRIEGEDKP